MCVGPVHTDQAPNRAGSLGYSVIEAANGGETDILCRKLQKPADLLLTDLMMPHMNGIELAKTLRVRRPGLRALYMSGYIPEAAFRNVTLGDEMPYLPKPFRSAAPALKVRNVLDA